VCYLSRTGAESESASNDVVERGLDFLCTLCRQNRDPSPGTQLENRISRRLVCALLGVCAVATVSRPHVAQVIATSESGKGSSVWVEALAVVLVVKYDPLFTAVSAVAPAVRRPLLPLGWLESATVAAACRPWRPICSRGFGTCDEHYTWVALCRVSGGLPGPFAGPFWTAGREVSDGSLA
jgi:hypothetical protein